MANLGVILGLLGDEDCGALNVVMNGSSAGGVVVDVLEALSKVSGDLYAGDP